MKSLAAFAIFLLAIAVVWELLASLGGFNRLLFPSLTSIFSRMGRMLASGELFTETVATLSRMFLGYAVAIMVGVPVGLWMGRSRLAEDLFGPLVNFLLPIPALALVPLFVLWFGLTLKAAILIISITSAMPIIVNTWSGSKTIDPIFPRVASSMGVTGTRFFMKVVLPSALPSIMIGLRQGLAMAWRAAIGAEFFAVAATGLGIRMFEAKDYIQMDVILSLLVVIMAVSIVLDKLIFAPLEARTIERWGMGGGT
ncbi:ABC transporter permease [Faunimonas sp. B44]|uniref:ABC transporter permease n=1 Tax=Faunimonas sp. B44 TaxID=3461493 RepID=UPI004044D3FD